MTTPVQQTVPEEFQQDISLSPRQPDQARIERAEREIARAREEIYDGDIAALRKKLGQKGLRKKEREKLQRQLELEQRRLRDAHKARQKWEKVKWEEKGRYDLILRGANRDAFSALTTIFNSYGLGSLAPKIYEFIQQGYGADTITLLLQDTPEYKQRFAGNEARRKAGLPVLDPAQYLATERAYRQILQDAGLPKGFYDNPADFTNWIAGDVSPSEIQGRVELAKQATSQSNPEYRKALQQMYGISESELTAYFLDRKRAVPLLERRAAAAQIGAAALRRGFETDANRMENLATMGIGAEEAEQGYGIIGETFDPMREIAQRFGLTWTQRDAEDEVFVGGTEAATRGRRLRSQERALFQGRAGGARAGLGGGYRQT